MSQVTARCRPKPTPEPHPQPYSTPPTKLQVWAQGGVGVRARGGVPSTRTACPGSSKVPSPGPVSPLLSQVKTQLQAQTVAAMAVGHQHPHQVGTVTPRSFPGWVGWMGPWAGRGRPVTLCPLPAERPGCLGDHLAAAGPGGAVAGCGWGRAPGHGRLGCSAGHLRLRQGLGAGATGEELPPTPRSTRASGLLSPSLSGPLSRLHISSWTPRREAQGLVTGPFRKPRALTLPSGP